ncbi:UNVERIFIED_CONTAM: hypothetical protein FKN15_061107 [Acipenser sinensis]
MKCKEGSAVLIIRVGDAFCGLYLKGVYFTDKGFLTRKHVSYKRVHFNLDISFTEGAACGQSLEERGEIKSQLETIFRASGFPFYVVHLEAVFSLPSSVLQCTSSALDKQNESHKEAVDGFIQSACSGTHRETGHGSNSYTEVQTLLSELSTQEWSGEGSTVTNKSPPFTPEQTEAVRTLLASVKTLTAREELLKTLRAQMKQEIQDFLLNPENDAGEMTVS